MLDFKLAGKRALVTGSSSGIGEAIARALAREGVFVVVHGRNEERAERVAVAGDLNAQEGGRASVALGDLSREGDADRVASRALEALGGIDILVNNAGGADEGMKPWLESTAEQWQETYGQNVLSAVSTLSPATPTHLARPDAARAPIGLRSRLAAPALSRARFLPARDAAPRGLAGAGAPAINFLSSIPR